MSDKKIMIVGDAHFPYVNKKVLRKIIEDIALLQPDVVVQIGDLYDNYMYSRYSKDPDYSSPEQESAKGRAMAEAMWSTVRAKAPGAKCYQILGNHDSRLRKRVADKLPEIGHFLDKPFSDLYKFEGVKTLPSEADELIIDGVLFIHGYLSKIGDHCKRNLMPTVVGHSHVGGTIFHKMRKGVIWELNAGFCADEAALPLQYGPQRTNKWTTGYGLIIKKNGQWCPSFVPVKS